MAYRPYVRVDQDGRYRGHGLAFGSPPAGAIEIPRAEARKLGRPLAYLWKHDGQRVQAIEERKFVRLRVSTVGVSGVPGRVGRRIGLGSAVSVDVRDVAEGQAFQVFARGAGLDEVRPAMGPRARESFTPTQVGILRIGIVEPELLDMEFGDRGVELAVVEPAPAPEP